MYLVSCCVHACYYRLHLAASMGFVDIVDEFLNVPVDCNVRDSHGTVCRNLYL